MLTTYKFLSSSIPMSVYLSVANTRWKINKLYRHSLISWTVLYWYFNIFVLSRTSSKLVRLHLFSVDTCGGGIFLESVSREKPRLHVCRRQGSFQKKNCFLLFPLSLFFLSICHFLSLCLFLCLCPFLYLSAFFGLAVNLSLSFCPSLTNYWYL